VLVGDSDSERNVFVFVDLLQIGHYFLADHFVLGNFRADRLINVFSTDVARDVDLQQREVVLHALLDLLHLFKVRQMYAAHATPQSLGYCVITQ